MSKDYIQLSGLTYYGYHGYYNEERKLGNKYTIDIKLFTDLVCAGQSDNIDDTINYATVYELISKEMVKTSNLLENIGFRIMKSIFQHYHEIHEINIKVTKPTPPVGGITNGISIEMTKKRQEIL